MIHIGDITKIKGNEAPTVDCIIGGSPCQDLSLAGKRAGLAGARSGLYMEQIRIIKEMRENDRANGRTGVDVRPRYMVWENVPGAFSTGTPKGGDFAAVLEEAIRVAEPEAPSVPVPEKGWPTAGCIVGECWSIAWRVLDAQYWGVPQRRRRICLVCDFNGLNAPKIVFGEAEHHGSTERGGEHSPVGHSGDRSRSEVQPLTQGLSGNPDSCQPKGEETAGDAGDSSCGAVPYTLKIRGGIEGGGKGALVQTDKSATLSTLQDQTLFQPVTVCIEGNGSRPSHKGDGYCESDTMYTLNTTEQHAVAYQTGAMSLNWQAAAGAGLCVEDDRTMPLACTRTPAVAYSIENHPADSRVDIDDSGKVQTLNSRMGTGGGNVPMVMESIPYAAQSYHEIKESSVAASLKASGGVLGGESENFVVAGVDCRNATEYEEQTGTLQADCNHNHNSNNVVRVKHIVRRLTPLECERLQGFPDGWTDIGEWVDSNGKKHKEADSPRYKALGNSIALPPWKWVLKRLCACYERDATMASLFDGIGGFPLIWEQINGKGSCLWASEIEEFPIAVTKARFGE